MIINIPASDGEGEFRAYLANTDKANAPGIVLIFEGYGLNAMIKAMADSLADKGFYVICPELYWRVQDGMQEYEDHDWNSIYDAESVLSEKKAIEDIDDAADFLRGLDNCSGKIAGMGFSLGGKLAFLASVYGNLDCNVAYYPLHIEKHIELAHEISKPLLIHFAEHDTHVPESIRENTMNTLKENDLISIQIHEEAGHGFAREGSSFYNETSAKRAQTDSINFILS